MPVGTLLSVGVTTSDVATSPVAKFLTREYHVYCIVIFQTDWY
jgi:hypothetical protein